MSSETALSALSDRVWFRVSEGRDKLTGESIAVPPLVPADGDGSGESRFSDTFPALAHLDRALALAEDGGFGDVVSGFRAVLPSIRWSQNPSYTEANCDRAFLDGYAYAAFSGPDAPIRCAAPRGGFMLMAPNVLYPAHEHGPREVYWVITPGTRWQLDHGDWFDVAPGDLILHRPWVPHAMRTGPEPMLAFAGWVEAGDRTSIRWGTSG
jgi:hypothetical protein